jgi:phosphotransferase system enzyme I (PtsI)
VFREQLRALARCSGRKPQGDDSNGHGAGGTRRCRTLLEQALEELRREGREAQLPPLGMMVEVPAAALTIEDFNAEFLPSAGNDLIQYVAAASRTNRSWLIRARPSRAVQLDPACRGIMPTAAAAKSACAAIFAAILSRSRRCSIRACAFFR